jgi:4-amino-4-deoxy-L-arabinose transferase-like glycosyltransferase
MADWSIDEQGYIKQSPLGTLLKSRLRISEWTARLLILLAVFLVALLPRIMGLDTFITADEDDQIMFASHFLKSVLTGNFGGALVLGYPGVPTLMLAAGGVAARYFFHYNGWNPLPWVTSDFFSTLEATTLRFGYFDHPLDFLVWVRLPMVVVAALAIVGIYLFTQRLINEQVALVAAVLLSFDPFILAHSRVVHVDAPMAYFMFLSFLAFMLYLDRGTWYWLIWSGLFGGLAGLSKTPAAVLGPILVLAGALFALFPPPEQPRPLRWKRLAIALVVWGLIAVAAVFALWPSMWARPVYAVQWIVNNVLSVSEGAHPTTGVFWNDWQSDRNPFYYLWVFPFHLTVLTTIGTVTGLVMIVTGLSDWLRGRQSWVAQMLPLALGLVMYAVVVIGPISLVARRGDRYILPVYFAIGLLAAVGLWWFAGLLVTRLPAVMSRLKLTRGRLLGALLLLQTVAVLLYHPYYLAYFNPLMGGRWLAPRFINIGWGEGLDVAARYLNQTTDQSARPVVAAWYSNQFAPYYQGQTIDLSNQTAALTADYTVFYINQVQRGFPSEEILDYFRQRQPEKVIKLGGIEYAWIYEGPVVSRTPPEDAAFPVGMLIGGGANLVAVDVPQTTLAVDEFAPQVNIIDESLPVRYTETRSGLPVTLYWETLAQIRGEHNVYIRLVDPQGNVWGQVDRMVLAGMWRPDRWRSGYFLRDEYRLPIEPGTPPGSYHLEVGVYDFETGQSYGVVKNIGELTLTAPVSPASPADLNETELLMVSVAPQLNLVTHTFGDTVGKPGTEIIGKIFWQAGQVIDTSHELEFSFLGPNRKRYIVHEQEPLSASYPEPNWRAGEVVGQAYRFLIPAVAPPGEYPLEIRVMDPDTGAAIGEPVMLANITVEEYARNFELPTGVVPVSVVVNDELELVGYKLNDTSVAPDSTFGLTLYWRSLGFADSNYTVFVHAVGPDQTIRGQWDSMPAHGAAPTSGWVPGQIVEDHFEVLMNKDMPPWKYDIFVGMYDPVTGERLPMFSTQAPVSDNRAWLTRVQGEE